LKQDSGRLERNFDIFLAVFSPVENVFNVSVYGKLIRRDRALTLDGEVVAVSDSGFQKDSNREGKLL